MGRGIQSRYSFADVVISVGLSILFLVFIFCGVCPPPVGPTYLVYASAWFASALWVLGSAQLLWLRPADWINPNKWSKVARWTWAIGWLALLAHSAIAFEVVHGWSHAAAYQHTARAAGVGEGVYVNYLVLIVWGLDAAWLAMAPVRYSRRPRWVGWAVHGFLAFVMFNATVVFGHGLTRWAGVGWFAILLLSFVRRRMGRPT